MAAMKRAECWKKGILKRASVSKQGANDLKRGDVVDIWGKGRRSRWRLKKKNTQQEL